MESYKHFFWGGGLRFKYTPIDQFIAFRFLLRRAAASDFPNPFFLHRGRLGKFGILGVYHSTLGFAVKAFPVMRSIKKSRKRGPQVALQVARSLSFTRPDPTF